MYGNIFVWLGCIHPTIVDGESTFSYNDSRNLMNI